MSDSDFNHSYVFYPRVVAETLLPVGLPAGCLRPASLAPGMRGK